jgi:hypothetical protein
LKIRGNKKPNNWNQNNDKNKDDLDNKSKKNSHAITLTKKGIISRNCLKTKNKENGMAATDDKQNKDNKEVKYSFCVTTYPEMEEN